MRRALLLAPTLLLACSTTVTGTAEIEGTVESASFPGTASVIEVRDEAGTVMRPKVEAGGRFKFLALEGHTYTMEVVLPSGNVPIVFPRNNGNLDRSFHVSGGGFAASLGNVRYYDAVPAGGFPSTQIRSGECDDDDHEHEYEGEEDWDDGEDVDEPDGDNNDGECEDGVDAFTGQPCEDDDDHEDGEEQDGPFAVPDNALPNDVGCGDDDDDDDEGDDEEDDD